MVDTWLREFLVCCGHDIFYSLLGLLAAQIEFIVQRNGTP